MVVGEGWAVMGATLRYFWETCGNEGGWQGASGNYNFARKKGADVSWDQRASFWLSFNAAVGKVVSW